MKGGKGNSGLVYSSELGRICPACGLPVARCACRPSATAPAPAGDGVVRIGRETKGRKGAGVTIIRGVPLDSEALKVLAGELKKRCGSGGTVKEGVIEIQGDHRELLLAELTRRGWRVKLAGG